MRPVNRLAFQYSGEEFFTAQDSWSFSAVPTRLLEKQMDVWTLFGLVGGIVAIFAIALAIRLPKNKH